MSLTPAFRYMNAAEVAALIKAAPSGAGKSWAVVDVRDGDFAGGNIVGAKNYPSETFTTVLPDLVKQFENDCALSQVRGPKAARRYAEARALLLEDPPKQDVIVLRDGFTGFQQLYRDDATLVEKFNKYYHD